MRIYWDVLERAKGRGWTNAHQLAIGAGISYPIAWRIMKDAPVERIDVVTVEKLMTAFDLTSPWSVLRYER